MRRVFHVGSPRLRHHANFVDRERRAGAGAGQPFFLFYGNRSSGGIAVSRRRWKN